MKLGIYLNQYRDSGSGDYTDLLEQAAVADEYGLDSVAVGERHFYNEGFNDLWTCLAALATRTDTVTIASNILILPADHPVHVAERMANLDRLTNGRTAFGIGVGYRPVELENFGASMDERGSRYLESLYILKRLLSGDRFDHDGEHYRFEDGFVRPEPVQSPRPPLLGAGSGDIAIKRAAYRCDGFTASSGTPAAVGEQIARYHDALDEFDKDPSDATVAVLLNGYVADSVEDARDALDPSLFDLLTKYAAWNNPHAERQTWDDVEAETLLGPPEAVAAKLREYQEVGVGHVFFRTQFPGMSHETALESLHRLGAEVAPRV